MRTEDNLRAWESFRTDVSAGYQAVHNTRGTVAEKLAECSSQIEAICRPAVERQFGKNNRTGPRAVLSWLGLLGLDRARRQSYIDAANVAIWKSPARCWKLPKNML